ncbi:MAG TPA: choice-of-anchor I family protein [Gemmatimonadales bacterium]|nr:choice-of-anchor I family protein [Gemmatimonadales bacterium]
MRHSVLPFATMLALLAACTRPPASPSQPSLSLEQIGTYEGGGTGAAEITAYDATSRRLFVVNGARGTVDVLDLESPSSPRRIATISVAQFGAGVNSVATHNGVVALAIEATDRQAPGTVAFYRATTLQLISSVPVGALPDMLTFSSSGRYVLVANEGEPSGDYRNDPEGSISVIDVSNVDAPTAVTVGFAAFNDQAASLRAAGVRIFGPNASVAQDLEPEFITIAEDERTAWVTLQENNALAIIDIPRATVRQIVPLGYKNHALAGNGLDVSDRDGPGGTPLVNIRPWPVLGMYQPDAIASYRVQGETWLVTGNEGDVRAYAAFTESARAGSLPLDTSVFTPAACGGDCPADARLGRLSVTTTLGRDGAAFDTLYAFGARSFSIRDAAGRLVWDSGDQLERLISALPMANFNAGSVGNVLDDRSDDWGPEPEGVAIGVVRGRTYAFIGLDQFGGVVVYDVTVPASPVFVTYVNTRDGAAGDRGPEGVTFVPAERSPSGEPLVILGNEISGTTVIFRVTSR